MEKLIDLDQEVTVTVFVSKTNWKSSPYNTRRGLKKEIKKRSLKNQ